MSCTCHEIPAAFGATGVACHCDDADPVVGLLEDGALPSASSQEGTYDGHATLDEWAQAEFRTGLSQTTEGGTMSGRSFTEAPHEFKVLRPNESPSRFGARPKSPAAAMEWDHLVAREKARAKEEADIEAEARRRLDEQADHDRYETRVQAAMRRIAAKGAA